jgi:hypothetical protein
MHRVLGVVRSKSRSNGIGGALFGREGAGGADCLPPFFNGIFSYQLNARHNVTRNEVHQAVEEGLALMLTIELAGTLRGEAGHLKFADHETALIYMVNDLAGGCVGVGLNHSKGSLSFAFKLLSGEEIAILNEFQLSGIDSDHRSNEKFIYTNSWASHALKENFLELKIVL